MEGCMNVCESIFAKCRRAKWFQCSQFCSRMDFQLQFHCLVAHRDRVGREAAWAEIHWA